MQESDQDNEQELVRRFVNGDEDAFHELHRLFDVALVRLLASRSVRSRELADDAAQETWIAVWEKRETLDPATNFRAWLFRIGQNKLIDHLRKRQDSEFPENYSGTSSEVLEQTESEHARRLSALKECLKTVGGNFMKVLRAQLAGQSAKDIMQRYKLDSPNTVYSRASRARERVKDCVEQKLK